MTPEKLRAFSSRKNLPVPEDRLSMGDRADRSRPTIGKPNRRRYLPQRK